MTAPTPTPTTWYDQQVITASDLNTLSVHMGNLFNRTMGGFRTTKPMVVATASAAYSTVSGTQYAMNWDTKQIDTDNLYHTSYFLINTAGWYRISLQIHWGIDSGGVRNCRIMLNGTNPQTNSIASDERNPVTIDEGTTTFCQCIARLSAGAQLYANIAQNSGKTIATVTGWGGCRFSAEYLAPYAS
jgi:hypothetical protein